MNPPTVDQTPEDRGRLDTVAVSVVKAAAPAMAALKTKSRARDDNADESDAHCRDRNQKRTRVFGGGESVGDACSLPAGPVTLSPPRLIGARQKKHTTKRTPPPNHCVCSTAQAHMNNVQAMM